MIYVTENRKDSVFVAEIFRKHRLSPIPVKNCYELSDYQKSNGQWERIIERYPWGVVLYVDKPNASATIVAIGDFDPVIGEITKNGHAKRLPISWYRDLVRRCEMQKIEAPACAGYWVAGVTCDGGINPDTNEEENACSWRHRCRLIQDHMIKLDTDPRTYLSRYGEAAIIRLLERLDKENKPKKRKKQKKKKKPKKKKIKKLTYEEKRERRYAPLKLAVVDFYEVLSKTVDGRRIVCCGRRTEAVRAGCIYLIDKTEKSVYYNVYLRRYSGRPHKLAMVRLGPINGGLDVKVPYTEQPEDLHPELAWSKWKNPPMFSVIRTLKTTEHYQWMANRLVADAAKALEASKRN